MARPLVDYDVLGEVDDIFYLTVQEIDAYIGGTSVTKNLKNLVSIRRDESAQFEREDVGHHFSTYGPVYLNNDFQYVSSQESDDGAEISGG